MKNNLILFMIVLIIACLCITILLTGLAMVAIGNLNTSSSNQGQQQGSAQGGQSLGPIPPDNQGISKAPQIYAAEILLLDELYNQFEKTNWGGEGKFPIKLSDMQQLLNQMQDYENKRRERLTMPDSYKKFYIDRTEVKYLQDLLEKSRSEYLDFIRQKGVNQKYIDEFERNALPADGKRLRYRDTLDIDAPSSASYTWHLGKDSSQRAIDLYGRDVYNYARQIEHSGLLGERPQGGSELDTYIKTARDMGVKMLAFHEFTHVLQISYATVNASASDKGKVDVALLVDRPLNTIDQKYFLEWGSPRSNAIKNNQASEERQANGISFQAMVELYKLDSKQAAILWEHRFGRLETAAGVFNRVLPAINKNYPKLRLDDLDVLLNQAIVEDKDLSAEQKELLNLMRSRFSIFGSDNGYYNPMAPEDAQAFWDMLK